MAVDSISKHGTKSVLPSNRLDTGNKYNFSHYSGNKISSNSAGLVGTPGLGSFYFSVQNRPKLMMRSSHIGSYFSHEGLIHLSGDGNIQNDNAFDSSRTKKWRSNSLEPIESNCYKSSSTSSSSGLLYKVKVKKELASIDAIHDPQACAIVCAGKSHLGYYKFSTQDRSLICTHDIISSYNSQCNSLQSKRSRPIKFSTIADVKTGFQQYTNHVAICSNSTIISVYDISKRQSYESAIVKSFAEHTRSINGFDFNMIRPHLILSGGQDGCLKIWDLRSNSAQKRSSGCDINITSTFGSIRDTKWMPGYNFASYDDKLTREMKSHGGYKFASIHDSGAILTFDLRQPTQPEKKINAHTGPGLCINWHPHQDYIVSGGRDGKCSLWYLGDKKPNDNNNSNDNGINMVSSPQLPNSYQNTYSNNNTASNLAVIYPETTINIGSPITKLKFRPYYDKNVYNSMLAISCMGDEAQVSIHSLARRYIPKHILQTSASAVGLVWWDSNILFDIDRNNYVNGWDLSKEPTVLETLPKICTAWRDIEGYGFTYIDQEVGSYKSNQEAHKVVSPLKWERPSRKEISPNPSSVVSSSGIINTLEMNNSITTSDKIPPKLKATYSSKSLLSTKSYNSNTNFSLKSGPSKQEISEKSPYVITLDLPYIFNEMRQKQLSRMQKELVETKTNIFKEMPVETFKYLVRKLNFLLENEKKNMRNELSTDGDSTKTEDERKKEDLMKKFGFTENATWTALVNKNNDERRSSLFDSQFGIESKKTGTDISDHLRSKNESIMSSGNDSELVSHVPTKLYSKKKDTKTSMLSKALQKPHINRKEKIQILLKLIAAVNHNANVYSDIGDISTFKAWIVIRDTLFWDLKKMDVLDENNIIIEEQSENSSKESLIDSGYIQSPFSDDSPYSSKIASVGRDSLSLVEEQPQALHDDSKELKRKPVSTLQKQLQASKNDTNMLSQETNQTQKINSNDEKSLVNNLEVKNDKSLISQSAGDIYNGKGMPILKRRQGRLSFIDTFMNDRRHLVGLVDETMSNRYAPSVINSSPQSKLSSFHSVTSGYLHDPFTSKILSHMGSAHEVENQVLLDKFLENGSIGSSSDEHCLYDRDMFSHKKGGDVCMPPWDTATIIKQLYQQAIESGNTLLGMNILLLFHTIYDILPEEVVKNSLVEFVTILHRFETFEIATALLKACPWDDIIGGSFGHSSSIQIYCDKCHKLLINEYSKERFTIERNNQNIRKEREIAMDDNSNDGDNDDKIGIDIDPMTRFGYWYCDNCKKPNSLCVYCEKPMKKLSIALLSCGHEGHFECFQEWFLDENMDTCPAGCNIELNL